MACSSMLQGALFLALALPAPASATPGSDEGTRIRVDQRTVSQVGRCRYTATLRGSYTVQPGPGAAPRIRDALIDVQTEYACPGAPPRTSFHEVYFEGGLEPDLLRHVADAAQVGMVARDGAPCALTPVVARTGDTLAITALGSTCPGVTVRAAQAGAHR